MVGFLKKLGAVKSGNFFANRSEVDGYRLYIEASKRKGRIIRPFLWDWNQSIYSNILDSDRGNRWRGQRHFLFRHRTRYFA